MPQLPIGHQLNTHRMAPIHFALVASAHPPDRWTSFGRPVVGMAISMFPRLTTAGERDIVRQCLQWQIRNLQWRERMMGIPMFVCTMNNYRVKDTAVQLIAYSLEKTIGVMQITDGDIYTSHGSIAVSGIVQGFEYVCDAAFRGVPIESDITIPRIPIPA